MVRNSTVILIILILSIAACQQPQKTEADSASTDAKDLVAKIKLSDLDGNSIDLKSMKGKVVFLNFWATWCKPCIEEMPSIDAMKQSLGGRDIVILAASDEPLKRVKAFADKYDFSFQFVKMESSVADLGIYALPTTFIIDKQGEIALNETGARDWNNQANQDMIKEMM
ncbi:MAG: TlpA disulfide reductase family protein [Bacteroidota bacterium]